MCPKQQARLAAQGADLRGFTEKTELVQMLEQLRLEWRVRADGAQRAQRAQRAQPLPRVSLGAALEMLSLSGLGPYSFRGVRM